MDASKSSHSRSPASPYTAKRVVAREDRVDHWATLRWTVREALAMWFIRTFYENAAVLINAHG